MVVIDFMGWIETHTRACGVEDFWEVKRVEYEWDLMYHVIREGCEDIDFCLLGMDEDGVVVVDKVFVDPFRLERVIFDENTEETDVDGVVEVEEERGFEFFECLVESLENDDVNKSKPHLIIIFRE